MGSIGTSGAILLARYDGPDQAPVRTRPAAGNRVMANRATDLKRTQIESSERKARELVKVQYEGDPHHDYFRALPFEAVKSLLNAAGIPSGGKTLVAACGIGTDLHYLRQFHSSVYYMCDISASMVGLANANHPDARGNAADIETLPYADDCFDLVFVASSLHHLPRPYIGLYELMRVAKRAVIVVEPNDSLLTRIASTMGLATVVEQAGNYVYRFSREDFQHVARALFYKCLCRRLFAIHRVAKTRLGFRILQVVNAAGNAIMPSMGNTICALIQK
jgi:ubiquinone/menaquinone biosynthesis C-methylase UbiE